MQKLQRVAQGAALSKVMLVSIVVKWRCAAPRLALGVAALLLAPRRRRARVRPWLACRLWCVTAAPHSNFGGTAARGHNTHWFEPTQSSSGWLYGHAEPFVRFVKPLIASAQ